MPLTKVKPWQLDDYRFILSFELVRARMSVQATQAAVAYCALSGSWMYRGGEGISTKQAAAATVFPQAINKKSMHGSSWRAPVPWLHVIDLIDGTIL
jgi:hypothetical protein